MVDFKEKADEFLMTFFIKQCSLININSKLPAVLTKKSSSASPNQQLIFRQAIFLKQLENINQTNLAAST